MKTPPSCSRCPRFHSILSVEFTPPHPSTKRQALRQKPTENDHHVITVMTTGHHAVPVTSAMSQSTEHLLELLAPLTEDWPVMDDQDLRDAVFTWPFTTCFQKRCCCCSGDDGGQASGLMFWFVSWSTRGEQSVRLDWRRRLSTIRLGLGLWSG
ncbi:hypothetical protein RRG08_038201 [Elysia crispata]|uniref:Uncharacterized protein n=1 Tax=Elysia crispata TaxID=231223 RepID=A0AAE1E220_9GAST|nr:hypothetical protein RRG08_038201 [Elysia crispata]